MTITQLLVVFLLLLSIFADQNVQSSANISYPIKYTYINLIDWTSADSIVSSLGVPDHSTPHNYNYIALTFYLCDSGPADIAKLWENPVQYMGATAKYGTTNDAIRSYLKGKYASKNIKLMLSAFGATEKPTSLGIDPTSCANSIADYVVNYGLDGVDVDYEDSSAFEQGTG